MKDTIAVNRMTTALALPSAPSKCVCATKPTHLTLLFPLVFCLLNDTNALVVIDSPFVCASNMPALVPLGPCLNKRNQ